MAMTKYVVSLPRVDEHEQGEDFAEEILSLSNHTDDDGRPIFMTNNLSKALGAVRKACEICRRHSAITEFNIGIMPSDKESAKGCQT